MSILCQCQLVFNPKKRIGVEEALEHPYLGDLHAEVNDSVGNFYIPLAFSIPRRRTKEL